MIEFLNLLLGSSNYILILVGFIWACFGAFIANAIQGHKPTNKIITIKLMSILIAMRCIQFFTGNTELTVQSAALIGLSIDGIIAQIKKLSKPTE